MPAFLARFGGEEFAVIFHGLAMEEVYRLWEEFREDFQKQEYDFVGGNPHVTVSLGLAKLEKGWSDKDWLDSGDIVMYKSKKAGKNRTTIWEKPS
ncbi:MAG: diguanylate cyclase [Anaerovoracaceae bacterium]